MRLSDVSDDQHTVGIARDLSRMLLTHRLDAQQKRISSDRNIDVESIAPPDLARRGNPLDLVYGAGIILLDGRSEGTDRRSAPVLLCDPAISTAGLPGAIEPLEDNDVLSELGVPGLDHETLLFIIPKPIPYFATAECVSGPGTTGSLGAVVREKAGQQRTLITTAGHVAAVGAQVTDAHGISGTVVWSHNPTASPSAAPAADIALIEPSSGGCGSGSVTINRTTISRPGDGVDVHGALTSAASSQTMGFTPALFVPQMAGMWAQLYFTTTAASVPGDSGAPVLASGSNDIVGHIVGGAPGLTSYIQAIDAQLQAINCTL